MKKSLLFFLPFLFIFFQFSFAQKAAYTDQEFMLKDLKMTEGKIAFQGNIEFNFKILGKYNRDEIEAEQGRLFPSYSLKFFITDEHGDTLIRPSFEAMSQSFSFFDVDTGKFHSYSFGHNIKIPYNQFKKEGNLSIILWGQAQNADGRIKLKPFKAAAFKIFIPKLHPLDQQQIKVSNLQASENIKKYNNDKGIVIGFSTNFTYDISELYSSKESLDEVLFYVDFTDAEGNPINSTYDPRLVHNSKNRSTYYIQQHQKNITKIGEIFVPYTQLFLPAGQQQIKYHINAISHSYSKEWKNLASGTFNINMPSVYFAKASIKNIQARDKSYDVAGQDIPIINIFISSKSSSGKGYPDLFWTFGTKNINHIYTDVVNNSFHASDDSCSFQMLEDDVLFLDVYDYDTFSFNDAVGSFTIPKLTGQTTYRSTLKSGDVISGEISIKRKPRPQGKEMSIFAKSTNYNGISGYQIWGNVKKDPAIQSQTFIRLADGTNESPNWQVMSPMPANANFSYFIPAWDLPAGAGFGFGALDAEYKLPIMQKYVVPDKYFTESQDVKINIKQPQASIQNGTNGILLEIDVNYPMGITNKKQCQFKYQFKELSGVDLKDVIEKLKMIGSPVCDGATCTMQVFIPYYLLPEFSGKQMQALFESEMSIKNKFVIGKKSEKISVQIPSIIGLPKAQLSLDLKFAKNWSYVNISTEHNGIQETFIKEKTEGGKITTDVIFPSEFAAENDIISIVITPYEFRTAMEPIRWSFTVKDLQNGTINFPKTKQAKKAFLKTH